jgi:hypothetical protein
VIPRRTGLLIERVEYMFAVANNGPMGERAFVCSGRLGGDVVTLGGIRVQVNT